MAGRNRRGNDRKSSSSSMFSMMSIFKLPMSRKSRDRDDGAQFEPVSSRKVRPSDEDRGCYVGEPDIDNKASAFITKFYKSRVMDPEQQTVAAPQFN